MGIFKCLQKLWHFCRSSRLFQWLFIAGSLALIIGVIFLKKPPLKEKAFTCFQNKEVALFFHPSKALTLCLNLPITFMQTWDDLAFTDLPVKDTTWKIAALHILSVGDLMAELSMKGGEKSLFPLIILIRDSTGTEYLIIGDEEKQISLSSMNYFVEHGMLDDKNLLKVTIPGPGKNHREPLSLCIKMNDTG